LLVFASPIITLIVYSLITKDWKINASLFALLLFLGIDLIVLPSYTMDLISMKELLQDNMVDKGRLMELEKAIHTKAFIASITISITAFSLIALLLLIGEKIGKLLFSRKNKKPVEKQQRKTSKNENLEKIPNLDSLMLTTFFGLIISVPLMILYYYLVGFIENKVILNILIYLGAIITIAGLPFLFIIRDTKIAKTLSLAIISIGVYISLVPGIQLNKVLFDEMVSMHPDQIYELAIKYQQYIGNVSSVDEAVNKLTNLYKHVAYCTVFWGQECSPDLPWHILKDEKIKELSRLKTAKEYSLLPVYTMWIIVPIALFLLLIALAMFAKQYGKI
jgi:hypothetical protein